MVEIEIGKKRTTKRAEKNLSGIKKHSKRQKAAKIIPMKY
jgi:hypothetical protein